MKIRHGDIPFYEVEKTTGEVLKHNGSFTVAEGEATGHHHVLTVANPSDMTVQDAGGNTYYITLKTEAQLTHPEHGTLTVPPGTYRTGREREMDWFSKSVRRVID